MPSRTPEQKLARELQAATGRKYCDCLDEARKLLAIDPLYRQRARSREILEQRKQAAP